MNDYEYLNTNSTRTIYTKLIEIEKYYNSEPARYCSESRIVAERVLKYLVRDCLHTEPDNKCGTNFQYLKEKLPMSLFPQNIQGEFSALLNISNKYHHDDEDDSTRNPIKDRYTIKCAFEYILPWLYTNQSKIRNYCAEKDKRDGCLWDLLPLGIIGVLLGIGKKLC